MEQEQFFEVIIRECISSDNELINIIRMSGFKKADAYSIIKSDIFDGKLTKADIFFSFRSLSIEMETFLGKLSNKNFLNIVNRKDIFELGEENFNGYPFDKADVLFYHSCRECYQDFQYLVTLIERHITIGVFAVLEKANGPDWIAYIDVNKRRQWAQIREDYRFGKDELALSEFTSIPDMRDIICNGKNWADFVEHLPQSIADKAKIKSRINDILIPIRNKIFHPTRNLSVTYTDYFKLKELVEEIDLKNWRKVEELDFSNKNKVVPTPNCY